MVRSREWDGGYASEVGFDRKRRMGHALDESSGA
jgi:hypothetical protein